MRRLEESVVRGSAQSVRGLPGEVCWISRAGEGASPPPIAQPSENQREDAALRHFMLLSTHCDAQNI